MSFLWELHEEPLLSIPLVILLAPIFSRQNRSCSISVEVSIPTLIVSVGILSGLEALPPFMWWMAFSIYCPSWSFAVYLEYFFSCCNVWRVLRWWPVQQLFKMFPPALQLVFITGKYIAILDGSIRVLVVFFANFLVISYSCFMFPWADASSASLASSSMKFAMSVFTLFLTALFASVYSSCAVAFAALVRLLLIAPFFSFFNCTLMTVAAENPSSYWYLSFPELRCM